MKKNLLFITTDQQRFDSLRAYGFDKAKTPNIDRLCSEGTVFENCYVTSPVCVASRATMMTGLYPSVTGTLGNASWLEDYMPTWPQLASQAGYRTAGIGKMHFAPWDVLSGFQERIICEDKRHYYIPDDHYNFLKNDGKKRICPVAFPMYDETCGAPFYPYSKEFYPDMYIADQTVDWLSKNTGGADDKPFAIWISFIGPHDPYDPPREYENLYDVADMPAPIPVSDDISDKTSYNICNEIRPGKDVSVFQCDYMSATDDQKKYWRKNYMTNLSVIDEGIGKIFKYLDDNGLWETTTIVFTSDHGDALGDHGMVFKMYYYESMVHVPLIIKGAGVPKGERRNALISMCDIVPFFLETMGLEPLKVSQGVSISVAIVDKDAALHDAVFSEMEGRYMAFDGRYKLTHHVGRLDELYDLENDPSELINCINKPEYAQHKLRLTELILRHMDDCNRARTKLSAEIACEKRMEIDKAYKNGVDVTVM